MKIMLTLSFCLFCFLLGYRLGEQPYTYSRECLERMYKNEIRDFFIHRTTHTEQTYWYDWDHEIVPRKENQETIP